MLYHRNNSWLLIRDDIPATGIQILGRTQQALPLLYIGIHAIAARRHLCAKPCLNVQWLINFPPNEIFYIPIIQGCCEGQRWTFLDLTLIIQKDQCLQKCSNDTDINCFTEPGVKWNWHYYISDYNIGDIKVTSGYSCTLIKSGKQADIAHIQTRSGKHTLVFPQVV